MRLLLVTEKCGPADDQRDGGARLVASLRQCFGNALDVLQFDVGQCVRDGSSAWRYRYPITAGDRFSRRMANTGFIGARVRERARDYSHVLFVHVSMQFGLCDRPLEGVRSWTFPMFLTPSYLASGEQVPQEYRNLELQTLRSTDQILTPSHLEKRQIVESYGIPAAKVRVIPRGVDRTLLAPRARALGEPLVLCSVGSIKRQKNTLELIRLFDLIRRSHPEAVLRIIGPIQDQAYAGEVRREIHDRNLEGAVAMVGYVAPVDLPQALSDAHVHLSASSCETFGRAIFETLASGIPNVARAHANAAAEYLSHVPYARFYDTADEAAAAVNEILREYARLSEQALEVGELFDDKLLRQLLAAELRQAEVMAVSDYDGTLYHKDDPERTYHSIEAFRRFPARVVCSARSVPDLLERLRVHDITADYLIGWSGAVIADGCGQIIWQSGFSTSEAALVGSSLPTEARPVLAGDITVQFAVEGTNGHFDLPGWRLEHYQGVTFVGCWQNSKLRAVHRLLRHLDWRGRVRAFGDGRYDEELLTYFDGTWIRLPARAPFYGRQASEVTCDIA